MNSLSSNQVHALLASSGREAVVYLIGAGGCGMSGLGHLLLDLGHRVAGSDLVLNEEVRQLNARGAQIFNTSQANRSVGTFDFGSNIPVVAGNFTLSFPTANASAAVLRIT